MKKHNPHFCIKNFRAFGEEGANFELAPITVLTGCNSAGKSSLVKALMLLSNKRDKMNIGGIEFSQKLKISSKEFGLGGYRSVTHGEKNITMSFRVWSPNLQEMLVVKREFMAKYNDALNDGVLYHLTVEKSDGTLVYQAGWDEGGFLSDNRYSDSIKTEFNRFYAVGCYIKVLEYLSLRKKIEKEPDNDIDISRAISSESALAIVQKRLKAAGTTESEAVSLWQEFSHTTFEDVICSTFDKILSKDRSVSISDLIEDHNEADEDWKRMMETFLVHVVNKACSPFFMQRISYINSTSAQIARLYSAEDDNKMCNALRIWNDRNIDFQDEEDVMYSSYPLVVIHKPGSFLNKWIKKFGIGESIELRGADEGLGLMVYLNKGGEKRLLADEGYGMTQLISLLLQIDNSIPVMVENPAALAAREGEFRYTPQIICVEEPEVHLHPKYQSLLTEMFAEAYQKYNIHFIIETHSEYLIRKLQVMVADKETALTPNDVSLNYVEKDENGVSTNRKIEILEDGRLSEPFGSGFYDEATSLSMNLLQIKMSIK